MTYLSTKILLRRPAIIPGIEAQIVSGYGKLNTISNISKIVINAVFTWNLTGSLI